MTPRARFLIALLPMLLMLGACTSDRQRSARLLDRRLQTQLAPDIAANRASVQSLPDGARVTLLGPSLYPNNTSTLDNREIDPRSSIIEGLLDPDMMRIQVADTSTLPNDQRDARVRNVSDYFAAYGLAPSLLPAESMPPESTPETPAGVAITISVACPNRQGDSGTRKSGCE